MTQAAASFFAIKSGTEIDLENKRPQVFTWGLFISGAGVLRICTVTICFFMYFLVRYLCWDTNGDTCCDEDEGAANRPLQQITMP